MISLFATILGLSYESKIRLSKPLLRLTETALVIMIIGVSILVLYGLCNPMVAVLDLSAAMTTMSLLLLKQR